MTDAGAKRRPGILLPLALGFGPGISFLLGYLIAPVANDDRIFFATAVFMIAAAACRLLAKGERKQRLWPFAWGIILVVGMGGLTLWLHDETFIKLRPTLYYGGTAVLGALHLLAFRRRLDVLMRANALDFDPPGQTRVTLLWIAYGLAMALLNELVWRHSSDLFWIGFQIWGPILAFIPFLAAAYPVISRHWAGACAARRPVDLQGAPQRSAARLSWKRRGSVGRNEELADTSQR